MDTYSFDELDINADIYSSDELDIKRRQNSYHVEGEASSSIDTNRSNELNEVINEFNPISNEFGEIFEKNILKSDKIISKTDEF
ncbi:1295_t:CDS:2 [Scutellospora calospora]|uniref:1295_t:CDS:1 n=1 Tax=Scutellospora calospora TaxID=85575 RepID=A0ACA9M7I2_9GLOM|nr:1295_t:CDS:2 [Scutellospora calospora]